MAAAIPRRSALAAIAVGLGTVLAGCDGSPTAEDSPVPPGPRRPEATTVPAPSPPSAPDATELTRALTRARQLAATARAISGADGWRRTAHEQVRAALDEQVRVLEELLRAGGLPVPTPSDTVGDRGTVTATVPSPDVGTLTGDAATRTAGAADRAHEQLQGLGRSCLEDVSTDSLRAVTALSAPNLPVLAAICGQRGATAALFAADPEWGELTGPTGASAAGVLGAYQPAVYGFEVLAARAHGDEREGYERVLGPLRRTTRQLLDLAGDAATPAPLGYGLPDGTDSVEGRRRLAAALTGALAPAVMGPAQAYVGDYDAVAGTVRLLAEAVHLSRPWVPMTGFPGLRVPDG